jgi:hypothetical protein
MNPSRDNPLRLAYWLGPFDPRPLALFRILLGLAVLHDLVDFTGDFRAFLGDDGMLPRSVPRDWYAWSLFDWAGGPAASAALFACGTLAVLLFTLGLWTRAATIASWAFVVSVHNRNCFVTDGGDQLTGILFFWSMFADLGGAWSLDARRAGRSRSVPAFGLRLLQLHIVVLYYGTARNKLAKGWLHGTAIYEVLQLHGFTRPLGGWLSGHPALCTGATYLVLAMETLFPLCALSPVAIRPLRALALAFGVAIQMGIALTMRAGIFQEAMLASCALFVLPEWLDVAQSRLSRFGVEPFAAPPPAVEDAPLPPRVLAWRAIVGLQFAIAVWALIGERRFPLPRAVVGERAVAALEQGADLFGTRVPAPHWSAPGVLADGSQVEVLSVAAPGLMDTGPAVHFDRWYKFTFKPFDGRPVPWPSLGSYLCRTYTERTGRAGARLASFDIVNDPAPLHLPDRDPPPLPRQSFWHQSCEASAPSTR